MSGNVCYQSGVANNILFYEPFYFETMFVGGGGWWVVVRGGGWWCVVVGGMWWQVAAHRNPIHGTQRSKS